MFRCDYCETYKDKSECCEMANGNNLCEDCFCNDDHLKPQKSAEEEYMDFEGFYLEYLHG